MVQQKFFRCEIWITLPPDDERLEIGTHELDYWNIAAWRNLYDVLVTLAKKDGFFPTLHIKPLKTEIW